MVISILYSVAAMQNSNIAYVTRIRTDFVLRCADRNNVKLEHCNPLIIPMTQTTITTTTSNHLSCPLSLKTCTAFTWTKIPIISLFRIAIYQISGLTKIIPKIFIENYLGQHWVALCSFVASR